VNVRKLGRLQAKAESLLREYETIAVLGNLMTATRRRQFERERNELRERPTIKKLSLFIKQEEEAIAALRRVLGVRASKTELAGYLEFVETAPPNKDALVPKYRIRELFTRASSTFDRFDDLPDHARFVLHRTKPPYHLSDSTVDWVCVEVLLYEDMCGLFNLAKDRLAAVGSRVDQRKAQKTANALVRAAASTALYFLESYLNGIAFDFFMVNEAGLDEGTKAALTEWDTVKNRPKRLGLRDKLLQYPRLILGVEHSPFQESNSPEIAYLAGRAKTLRDSVVHASPRPDPHTFEPEKESNLFNPDFHELERIVDSAIALVRKIEISIHGDDRRLFWLYERGADGFFPRDVSQ
jgi:hypothetical protein